MYRPETPPTTPQRARATARRNERNDRILDSPEHRRIPNQAGPPHIAPLHYHNVVIPQVPVLPENALVPDDPFASVAPPVSIIVLHLFHIGGLIS